jgi:hypothetical protein
MQCMDIKRTCFRLTTLRRTALILFSPSLAAIFSFGLNLGGIVVGKIEN